MPSFTTLVDDAFPQADGPLETVNWTLTTFPGGNSLPQVVSHVLEPSTTVNGNAVVYTGAVAPPWAIGGQFLEITISTLTGLTDGTNFIDPLLFADVALDKGLAPNLQPAPGGNILIQIFNFDSSQIGTDITLLFVPGAKYRVEVFGGVITHFYNGTQIGQYAGQNQYLNATGIPGLFIEAFDVVTNVKISRFTAGIITGPPFASSGSELDFGYRLRF